MTKHITRPLLNATKDDVVIAFVQTDLGMRPCHVSSLKKGDVFYLVVNGLQGELLQAQDNARRVEPGEPAMHGWAVRSVPFEG